MGIYHHLLGTNVEIRVTALGDDVACARRTARLAQEAALARAEQLQTVLSVVDPASEVSRWRRGEIHDINADLVAVLAEAARWWQVSGAALHPATGRLRERWLRAAADGIPPLEAEIADLVRSSANLPYVVEAGGVRRVGECAGVDLNCLAKGYVVDAAAQQAASVVGVVDVLLNAGGDLRHLGAGRVRVGVEDPRAVGGRPLATVSLTDGAIATSGPVHRGFRVGGTWFGHVLDPRTGYPVEGRPSTTVRAADAMTADAVATVAGVLPWGQAADLVAGLPGVEALAVLASGEVLHTSGWPDATEPSGAVGTSGAVENIAG